MSDKESHDYAALEAPWMPGPSIYQLISEQPAGVLSLILPDTDVESETRWAPGARDAVAGNHAGPEDETLRAKQVVKALRDLLASGAQKDLVHLHRLVTRAPILGILDQVLGEIVEGQWIDPTQLHDLADYLARAATERDLVKLAIGVLGILSGSDDRELLMTLGRHEEFTLYAVVAFQATCEDAEDQLLMLAQSVVGWGRIHVVERLALSDNPEVHAWLLREGFRSDIMDVYLSLLCARVADLADALERPVLDERLLEGAAEILFSLCEGSPDEDIDDYEDAALACLRYIEALELNPQWWSTTHLRTLARISTLLSEGEVLRIEAGASGIEVDPEYLWQQREENSGWTPARRESLEQSCARLLSDERWLELVTEGLQCEGAEAFRRALAGADALGLDTSANEEARLRGEPTWLGGWHRFAEVRANATRMVELFREVVDLERLGQGPDLRYDFDEDTSVEDALSVVLEASVSTSERPWDLLLLGLTSPWVRVRATAINTLDAWIDSGELGKDRAAVAELMEASAADDPSEELSEMLRASAAGLRHHP